ncbi:MAG: ECF transporter S component [Candidatus Bathyarchaeota archaeon]|jgi:hypothetical protein|nr:ECF transporter S component [Candidatus Bathyarchaeota archaeon A05DMB-5]MDH7557840.1 ECF transporter S component [Candidatus Bathyarchaeota archaeon]
MLNPLKNSRATAFFGVLTGLCLAVQLAPRPPNVEFTSLFSFVVGFLFGSFVGVFFGGFVMFVNGFFSPWGFAGLNMPFQMLGMSVVGGVGGLYKKYTQKPNPFETAVLGAALTVFYDLVTNMGMALFYIIIGTDPTLAIITALGYGTPFSLIHTASNIAVFGLAFFPLIKAVNQLLVVEKIG